MRLPTTVLALAVLLTACQPGPTISPISPTATSQASLTPQVVSPSATFLPTRTAAPSSTPTPSSKIPVNVDDLRGVQLELWHPWTGSLSDQINTLSAEFNQSNIWGITVKALSQGSESGIQDALSGSGGTVPHPLVIAAPPEAIAFDQTQANTIVDLATYLTDPQWGLSQQEMADFSPIFWPELSAGEKQFSIPWLGNLSFLIYNRTWAQALGYQSLPASISDFQDQGCAAAKANLLTGLTDNAGTGGYIVNNSGAALLSWLSSFEKLPASDLSTPFIFNTAQSSAAFGYLRGLYDKNCAWSGRNPTPYEYFAQRKAIFYSATLEDLPFQQRAMAQQKNSDDWIILAYPGASSQPAPLSSGYSLAIINGKPKEQLAAWLFLRWMILPRNEGKLAASGSLLPVSKSALELISSNKAQNPQWAQAAGWIDRSQAAFSQGWWYIARPVLEDAAWQIFQPFTKPASIPDVLKELDSTVSELVQH
jgi:multiple sugar transport system substrate-binding protein